MEELKIILLTSYFTANAYLSGHLDSGYNNKIVWWKTLLFIWFAIPYFIFLFIMWGVDELFKKHKWYHDFKFWCQLNLSNQWKGLSREKVETIERVIENTNCSDTKSEWSRIKKKYNYTIQ